MSRIPQPFINTLVILMALGWLVQIGLFILPYTGDYYEGLPDEVAALDEQIEIDMESVPLVADLVPTERLTTGAFIDWNSSELNTPLSGSAVYEQAKDSVVYINQFIFDNSIGSFGSGSIVGSNGVILTNYHVIEGAEKIAVTLYDGTTYPVAEVLATDPGTDIALLKIDATNLPTLPVATSDTVQVGDVVYSLGHPENVLYTFAVGNISGIREFYNTGEGLQLQFTSPISEGSSGGALLNEYGQLIGLPSAGLSYDANSVQVQNINFAATIDSVLQLIE